MPRAHERSLRAACLAVSIALLACQAPASRGAGCARSADCSSGLTCALGRCRAACRSSRDCEPGARCLVEPATGIAACSIETVDDCTTEGCIGGLVCHMGQCVNACGTVVRCPDGTCVGDVCVSSVGDAGTLDAAMLDGSTDDAAGSNDASSDAAGMDASSDASSDGGNDAGADSRVDAGSGCTTPPCDPVVHIALASEGNSTANGRVYAVTASGALWAWGYATYGLLGDGVEGRGGCADCSFTPVRALGPGGIPYADAVDVSAGQDFACVLRRDTSVWCWGRNYANQCGSDGIPDDPLPHPVVADDPGGHAQLLGATAIASGARHTCVLRAGEVWCWGTSDAGGLGDGSSITAPVAIHATEWPAGTTDLELASHHTMALRADQTVAGVGDDACSELGATASASAFTLVGAPGTMVRSFASCDDHTCILTSAGALSCWGRGDETLGAGSPTLAACPLCTLQCTSSPQSIVQPTGSPLVRLFGRSGSVFGVTAAGALYTWGRGIAPLDHLTAPTLVPVAAPIAEAYAGGDHACALTVAGNVLCWGDNTHGQLGRGTVGAGGSTPVAVVWP